MVAPLDGQQFLAGARLRVRRGVSAELARGIAAELVALGGSVELEPQAPPDEAVLALDQLGDAGPEREAATASEAAPQLSLVSLDDADSGFATDGRSEGDAGSAAGVAAVAEGEGAPATPTPPVAPADDERRFRPSGDFAAPMDLQLDIAPPVTPSPRNPAAAATEGDEWAEAAAASGELTERAVEAPAPVPGRIAGGALRANPAARIAVGVALGLGLGWLVSQPYAERAERRVAALRGDADRERYRPVDDAQARVRALDDEADGASSHAAMGTALIWIAVAGGVFAGWWRAT